MYFFDELLFILVWLNEYVDYCVMPEDLLKGFNLNYVSLEGKHYSVFVSCYHDTFNQSEFN